VRQFEIAFPPRPAVAQEQAKPAGGPVETEDIQKMIPERLICRCCESPPAWRVLGLWSVLRVLQGKNARKWRRAEGSAPENRFDCDRKTICDDLPRRLVALQPGSGQARDQAL